MKETIKKRVPQLKISSWYILILCAVAAGITAHLFSMYGIVHWSILSTSYKLKSHIENVSNDEKANQIITENDSLKNLFDDLRNISKKFDTAGLRLMGKTGLYPISGLVSFILAIFAFFCRPRWVGLIALPIGIYSLNLAMIIM